MADPAPCPVELAPTGSIAAAATMFSMAAPDAEPKPHRGYGLARMPNFERFWLGAASIVVISPSRTATLIGHAAVPAPARHTARETALRAH